MANKRKRENEKGKQKKIPRTRPLQRPQEEKFDSYPYFGPQIKWEIALQSRYKDLISLCNTFSKSVVFDICGSNYFWEKKTQKDFGDLYDIEEFGENWWHTYQHYRSVFSKDFISALAPLWWSRVSAVPSPPRSFPLSLGVMKKVIDEKGFLIVDETDERGNTALMHASLKGFGDIVQFLLEEGSDPNLANISGQTALIKASLWGRTAIVRMLLAAEADPNLADGDGRTALMWASKKGYTDIVRMLLAARADPNLANGDGRTALMQASWEGHRDIVEMLLAAEADPDFVGGDGTALIRARGHRDIVEMLLAAEADPDLTDGYGRTALMQASWKGHRDIVEMLLAAKADPDLTDLNGSTALMRASENGHRDIVEMLLAAKADPDLTDLNGRTALMRASERGHIDIEMLLNARANSYS